MTDEQLESEKIAHHEIINSKLIPNSIVDCKKSQSVSPWLRGPWDSDQQIQNYIFYLFDVHGWWFRKISTMLNEVEIEKKRDMLND